MCTQPFVIEAARLHDFISTIPAVAFVEFAFGQYLDYHATERNTERKAATYAVATLKFGGDAGTVVSADTQVSTEQIDANIEPVMFVTTETASIYGPLGAPLGFSGAVSTGGILPPGDYYYVAVAYDAAGNTLPSDEYHAVVSFGSDKRVTLSWLPVLHAVGYYVYRGTVSGGQDHVVQTPTNGLIDDGGLVWDTRTPPIENTTGGKVNIPARAVKSGSAGNVAADALTQMVTFNSSIATVTNVVAASDGSDVESDFDLQARLELIGQGEGPGRPVDYVRWATDWPGVERAQTIPIWDGPGTVRVVAMDGSGNDVSTQIVSDLQQDLDPYPGLGGGTAPIDHIVTVVTPDLIPIDIAAAVTFRPGYSYSGVGNTTPIRQEIVDALTQYLNNVDVGEDILKDEIQSLFYTVEGVRSVNLTAPSSDTTVLITATPPQKASIGTITLT